MTTFIEFVGGVTFLVHLLFFSSPQNAFSTLLHSILCDDQQILYNALCFFDEHSVQQKPNP